MCRKNATFLLLSAFRKLVFSFESRKEMLNFFSLAISSFSQCFYFFYKSKIFYINGKPLHTEWNQQAIESRSIYKGERSKRASLNKWIEGNRRRGNYWKIVCPLAKTWTHRHFLGSSFYRSESQHSYHREKFSSVALRVNRLLANVLRPRLFWCNSSYQRMFALLHTSRRHPIRKRVWLLLQHWRAAPCQCDVKTFCFLNRHAQSASINPNSPFTIECVGCKQSAVAN